MIPSMVQINGAHRSSSYSYSREYMYIYIYTIRLTFPTCNVDQQRENGTYTDPGIS